MTSNQKETEHVQAIQNEAPSQRSLDARWTAVLHYYGRLNRLSHHTLSIGIKLLVVLYVLFCLLVLVLRYALLPHIANYKTDIEHILGSSLGRTVSIAEITSSWQGLRPSLELKQVAVRDLQGQSAVILPDVRLTVSWKSLLVADVRLYSLEINRPELELKRSPDGKIMVAGWWLDPAEKSDSRGLNWLLSQRAIVIKNGTLRWTDQLRGAPVLVMSDVNFIMQNRWQHHKLSLTAIPPANLAGPVDIRADFKHRLFSDNITDFLQWQGQLYADFAKTDLSAWKAYFDYPIDIEQGVGAVRAWFEFDRAKVVDFTADLKLVNVKTQLRNDLQPLDLLSVSGRISAQEMISSDNKVDIKQSNQQSNQLDSNQSVSDRFREHGHEIELTNFTFETRSGMKLPATTLSERFIPASATNPEQIQFSTQFLDLNILANLVEHFPIPKVYRDQLQSIEPAGQLSDFSVSLQGKYPELLHYRIAGQFHNLAMKPTAVSSSEKEQSPMPGFTNLTGKIDADEKKGTIYLASTNLLLLMPGILSEPELKFDRVDMRASWQFQKDRQLTVSLGKLDITQQDMKAHFFGSHVFPAKLGHSQPKDNKASLGILDLTGSISHFDIQKVGRYLPLAMDPDLYHWLSQGLMQGRLDDVQIRIKGDLAKFPFVKKDLLDTNRFNVTATIVDGKINYLPGELGKDGVNPFWPLLSKIQGKIEFDRESMDIVAKSGETDNVPVTDVHARIPDLFHANPMLEIDGTATAPAQDMLHYVSVSPVFEWINHFTEDTRMTGLAKVKLRLDLPLFHPLDAKVVGDVNLKGNDVVLLKEMPLVSQVAGQLDFNERGLKIEALTGNFLGGKATVGGGTQKDGVIRIKVDGQVTADAVRYAYPQPVLKNVLTHIDGKTSYSAIVQVKNKQTDVWVDSSLQGMALRLPAPVSKAASDILPVSFELLSIPVSRDVGAGLEPDEQDEMKLSLGGSVNVRYLRQKETGTGTWKVVSGGIGVNAPAPLPESGLSAQLELTSFNIDELQALMPDKPVRLALTRVDGRSDKSPNKKRLNKNGVVKEAETASELNLSPYLEPTILSAQVEELTLMGKKLEQVVLGASHFNGVWQSNIESKQISGYLTWDNAGQGLGHVTARLGSLVIPETAANDVVDILQSKRIHSSIPGLDVIADHVELFGKKLGRLELQAKNVNSPNQPMTNEWRIDRLSLVNPDAELTAEGKWTSDESSRSERIRLGKSKSPRNKTELDFQLNLINAGKLLDRLGYERVLSGGKGKIIGDISWSGSPYSMDMPTLSGKVRLDLQSGQFLKVEPGAAKLLAVLNLQALPRRLLLDFRDVFSDGFAFDGITGDAQIEKGIATSDNLKMRSVAATVLLSGQANITDETQDLHVAVVPEVNAGAASVVYGLAVNPVIGLGTFLAQLFLRNPLMKAFTFEYQISGSWKEPFVVKKN